MFASTFATGPLSGADLKNNLKYVNNIHNFILLPSIVLSFIHIYVLTPFFKLDLADAGWTPTTWSHTSNSRGIGGILSWPRHTSKGRIPYGNSLGHWRLMMSGMLYCIYVVASDRYTKTCCSTNLSEKERSITSLCICSWRSYVLNGSFICLLASVSSSLYSS